MDGFMIQEFLWMLRYWKRELSPTRSLKSWQDNLGDWNRFWKSYRQYQELSSEKENVSLTNLYPCLGDATAETYIEPTYFYQDCWAFEKIVQQNPSNHIDIGSHHKYVALLSKVVPVTMVDIRPLSLPLESLNFKEGSILNLPFEDNSVESISSLCVIEHIGLGRYGDTLDCEGSEKAINELKRVLKTGGHLYISIPVGIESLTAFNAGRIFSLDDVYKLLHPLKVIDSSFIVGNKLTNKFEYIGGFATTGLFEITKD
jgi:SAM-dependent methyltransferase